MAESQPRSFTFISGDPRCRITQETIRVHVMRLHHSQRRQRRNSTQRCAGPDGRFEGQFYHWGPDQLNQDMQGEQAAPLTPASISTNSIETPGEPEYALRDGSLGRTLSLPTSMRSFANTNAPISPLSSLLEQSTEEMLIQYYLRYGGGSDVTNDFYCAYRETPAAFSAFLATVATSYSEENTGSEPINTAELENQALREVTHQLSRSPTAPASSVMLTVALLANLRECRHEHDLVKWHWNGLKQMVNINGGVQRLRLHQDLYAYFFWVEAVVLSASVASLAQITEGDTNGGSLKQELHEFLQDISTNTPTPLSQADGPPKSKLTCPILRSMHQPAFKSDAYSLGKWRRARLASLIFFAVLATRSEFCLQDDPDYQAIAVDVLEREGKYTVYPEELYYALVRFSNQDHLCQTTWKVARLVNVVKLFVQRDINTCYRVLKSYLGFSDPYESRMVSDELTELSTRMIART